MVARWQSQEREEAETTNRTSDGRHKKSVSWRRGFGNSVFAEYERSRPVGLNFLSPSHFFLFSGWLSASTGTAVRYIHSNAAGTQGSKWTRHTLVKHNMDKLCIWEGGVDLMWQHSRHLSGMSNSSLTRRGSWVAWKRMWKFAETLCTGALFLPKKQQMLLTKEREWKKQRSYWNEAKLKRTMATISI